MTYNFDATEKSLGRLASQVALALRGKNEPSYTPHVFPTHKVVISNILKAKFTGTKLDTKIYYRHSGFPGGIKSNTMAEMFAKSPKKLFELMVWRMLPKNRSRIKIMKNLEIN